MPSDEPMAAPGVSGQVRRERERAQVMARTGIDEAMIVRLVDGFYARVREDTLLAPVFEERISGWQPHLDRMYAFWSSVVLLTGRYHGRPMPMHATLPVSGAHFDRWLALFGQTARDLCPPAAAAHFIERAERIAASLEQGIAVSRGTRLKIGERLGELDG